MNFNENWQKWLLGISVLIAGIVIVWLVVGIPKQTDEAIRGGSVTIEIKPEDQEFFNQIQEEQDPQAPDPAFGGSAIEQSPKFDLDTWHRIIDGDL